MESLEDACKSDAVVSAAGEAGSVTSERDANSKGTTGSMGSSGVVEEAHVLRSSGSNPLPGDPDGGTQTTGDSWDTHFKDLRDNNTHPQCREIGQNLLYKGFISWDSLH